MTAVTTRSLPSTGVPATGTGRLRPAGALAAGAAVFLAGYFLLSGRAVPAGVAGFLPLVLVLTIPSSRRLSRRVAVNGLLLLALVPSLWWIRWPVAVDHGAVVVAGGAGALGAWVLAGATTLRLRRLVPAATRSDLFVLLSGVLAVVTTHRWWAVGSPHAALTVLLQGYDNSAHFDIFSKMLTHGATLDSLGGAPDGSAWSLTDYPQGFHAVAASYAELTSPGTVKGPEALVAYSHCIAAVVVLGMIVLVAAVCSLPGLRARPLVAAPTVVAVSAAFLWGPGAKMLLDGFVNFWLAALVAGAALVLAMDTPRRLSPMHWAALGAAFVVIAHSWAPLLLLAAPAAAVALPVRGHAEPSGRHRRALTALVGALAALGILRAAWLLLQAADVGDLVTAQGAISNPSPLPTMLLVPISLITFLEFGLWVQRSPRLVPHAAQASVVRRLCWATLTGVVSLAALLTLQLRSGGVAYYFFKYLVGFELVIGTTTAAAAGVCLGLCLPMLRGRRPGARLVSLAACLVVSQAFGAVGWRDVWPAAGAPRRGSASVSPPDVSNGILDASRRLPPSQALYTDYLAPTRDGMTASVLPDVWVHAINGGMTTRQLARTRFLVRSPRDLAQLTAGARRILESDARARLLVRPRDLAPLRSGLGEALADRVTTWPSSSSVQAQGER